MCANVWSAEAGSEEGCAGAEICRVAEMAATLTGMLMKKPEYNVGCVLLIYPALILILTYEPWLVSPDFSAELGREIMTL